MARNRQLANLPDAITTDTSNNVGIGGSPSGTYKFEVTGTGRFTDDVTIFKPSATTALRLNTTSSSYQGTIYFSEASVNKWEFGKSSTTPNLYFYSYGTSSSVFSLNYSTGAATFSDNVLLSATKKLYLSGTSFINEVTTGMIRLAPSGNDSFDITSSALNIWVPTTLNGSTSGGYTGLTIANASTGSAGLLLNNSAQAWLINTRTDNNFSIYNGTASTTPFFINTSGNVGIGTSSPVGLLNIYGGDANAAAIFTIQSSTGGSGNSGIYFRPYQNVTQASANPAQAAILSVDDNYSAYLSFQTKTSGALANALVERMRITNGGTVSISNNMTIAGGGATGVIGIGDTTTSSNGVYINTQTFGNRFMKFSFQGNPMGEIYYNGTNTSYAASGSDIRLKKNIKIWDENILDLFKDINPKTFNWNFQEDTDTKSKGFIAQEMTEKFPEAYHTGDNDYYLYNPSGMVVYLIKALQEQTKINQEYKDRLDKLENK